MVGFKVFRQSQQIVTTRQDSRLGSKRTILLRISELLDEANMRRQTLHSNSPLLKVINI